MRRSTHLHDKYVSLISFVPFYFIQEMLSIFVVMTNFSKTSTQLFLRLGGEKTLTCCCIIGSRAEKLNIVSNDHGHTEKCDFSVLDHKYPF